MDASNYIAAVLRYIIEATELKVQDFFDTIETSDSITIKMVGMTLAEEFRRKGYQKGQLDGIEKGKSEALKTTAIKLLEQGLSIDRIADITGLSVSEIIAIKNT